jgi:hypothetical protein
VTRSAPRPAAARRAQAATAHGRNAAAGEGDDGGHRQRAGLNWQQLGLRVAGAGLLAVTGATHLDLYLTGYRSIPVIGPLFLLQVIAAFGLAAAVLVTGSRLAAAAGAGFALSTLGATSCRYGSACSGSRRSGRLRGSSQG